MELTDVRIYGIPLEELTDAKLGLSFESDETSKLYGILYCGFKTPFNEVFQPTNRLWYLNKVDVKNTGVIDNLKFDENAVNYYDININTTVLEKFYQEVQLIAELSAKANIFARKVAITPESYVDDDWAKNKTREELETMVMQFTESEKCANIPAPPPHPSPHPTLYHTVKPTRVFPFFVVSDSYGGDSDYH
ncbi:hypothetical protein L21_1425 [Methanoculleus chikugoensis]|uniref:Uncharacterized protein n=1 Tax=Methanoculleus chikugoensis TaxID=118126 RepID=A0A1M4MKR2_9EURY|nr:hypothetical protein [Methanoculleus chikugoensis]SCL75521.1 hypothetical protein L21_1425 [Methanoculleus chikugoensis]